MARTEAQSDFVFRPQAVEPVNDGPICEATGPVELPRAQLRSSEPSEFTSRWMVRLTLLMLLALALLCAIGPHLPSGE